MPTKQKETRIRLDPMVHESLRYYIAEERQALKATPGAVIDENTVVSDLTRRFLTEKGHYPPRTANLVEEAVTALEGKTTKNLT